MKTIRNRSGRVNISIALTGIIGLAGLCFLLYIWSNMPESGIENPEIGDPLLLIGGFIALVVILLMLLKYLR